MIPQNATVAFNPLQWFATEDGWLDWSLGPSWPELMSEVKRAGFDAVHTRVPAEYSAREYGEIIANAGLRPAAGTFGFNLPEDGLSESETLDGYARTAEDYAELGLDRVFVLAKMNPMAPRVAHPGVGAEGDVHRLDRIVSLLTRIGEVTTASGVLPILHPHAGTWVETADETRYILDHVDPALLGFGPDIGHLSWAGADPTELVREYRDRVGGAHLKDFRRDVLEKSRAQGWTYRQTVGAGLWTEPGRGDFDYEALWNALGADFAGTLVVEVDKGDLQPPFASAEASGQWAKAQRSA